MMLRMLFLSLVTAWSPAHVFDSNGVKISYVTEGAGEAVVLIHGWMGDSTMWGKDASGNPKLEALPGFQVIAFDCRGHGKSDKPHETNRYGVEMANDVVRLLDHLKVKKAHLIGYSMGAFIAGKVAAAHPERVLTATYGGQAPLLTGEAGAKEIDVFIDAVAQGKGLGPYIQFVRPGSSDANAKGVAEFMFKGKDVKAFAAAGGSFAGLELNAQDLVKANHPTLFLYGSKESENTITRVLKLSKALAKAEVKVIEGADHVTTLIKPDFGKTLVAFLLAHKGGNNPRKTHPELPFEAVHVKPKRYFLGTNP